MEIEEEERCYAKVKKIKHTDKSTPILENMVTNQISKKENMHCEKEPQNVEQLYSVVNNSAKQKERQEAASRESSDITEIYSVVNKKSKKGKNDRKADEAQQNSTLYAVVDKSAKKQTKSVKHDISQMYAGVDKTRKK